RLLRKAVYEGLFPHYRRMEIAALPLRAYSRSGLQGAVRRSGIAGLLPGRLRRMEAILPASIAPPLPPRLHEVTPPPGERRGRVAFHLTCVNNIVLADASAASVRVLARNGCEVVAPRAVACCGAPHETEGEMEIARRLARQNIALYEAHGVDA